jgi:hypothetical protein
VPSIAITFNSHYIDAPRSPSPAYKTPWSSPAWSAPHLAAAATLAFTTRHRLRVELLSCLSLPVPCTVRLLRQPRCSPSPVGTSAPRRNFMERQHRALAPSTHSSPVEAATRALLRTPSSLSGDPPLRQLALFRVRRSVSLYGVVAACCTR